MSFCSICYEEDDEKTYTTKCNHKFHYKCLYKWLYDYNEFKECPLCKTILPDSEDILPNKVSVTGTNTVNSYYLTYQTSYLRNYHIEELITITIRKRLDEKILKEWAKRHDEELWKRLEEE